MTTLGERLKIAREKKGLSQIQVKERTNINNKTLSGYEKDVSEPDTKTLSALAELYEVSYRWLLTGKGNVKEYQTSIDDKDIDDELQEFIDNVKVWYKEEPETKEERLRMMKKMFEVFKEYE